MKDLKAAKIILLDDYNKPAKRGILARVAVHFIRPGNSYLDEKIRNTPYFDTGDIGFVSPEDEYFIFASSPALKQRIGEHFNAEKAIKFSQTIMHRFKMKDVIRKNEYFLVTDTAYGFRHIYPYPGKIYLKEYYKKFTSSPQLRNFFFEYHSYVLMKTIGKKSLNGLKVLDVAAGDGSFLEMLKRNGALVTGFEPSVSECAEALKKDLPLINDAYNPDLLPRGELYDIIIAGNIFEHIPYPYQFMERIKRRLKKNGYLFFQIPNDFNLIQHRYLENSGMPAWFICPPEHLNYWNVEQARCFVIKCGFNVIHEEAQFPIEIFLLFGMDYRKHPELGKEAHRMRCNFENAFAQDMDILSRIYSKFIEVGIGRDYVAILQQS